MTSTQSGTNYTQWMPNYIKKLTGSNTGSTTSIFNKTLKPGEITSTPGAQLGKTDSTPSTLLHIVSYFLVIVIILVIILLIIHNFITPIFQFIPGTPCIIPIGMDDGVLFWNKASTKVIEDKDLPIFNSSSNYTLNIDMFIENPIQFSKNPRIIFTRGGNALASPLSGDTLLSVLSTYNLAVALAPNTTDLIVSVLNTSNISQNIILYNVPVQMPFRLGIAVMDKALEVYLNNKLVKTKSLASPPMSVRGDIIPSSTLVKLRNLKIWNRILTTSEIIHASPNIASQTDFGAGQIPSSTTCS